jgi:hypothetical protein
MLTELHSKQDEKDVIKRWFQDEYFDLFTWQDYNGTITGFQLCYERLGDERVLSWDWQRGFGHHRVDDGEASPHKNMSPIFVRNGGFSYQEVMPKFVKSSDKISQAISLFIIEKIKEYVQVHQKG